MIKKEGSWLKVHQQVQIAAWASLSPDDGAEHCDPASPARPRDAKDVRAMATQPLQRQHIISHDSKISPHTQTTLRIRPACRAWDLGYGRGVPRVSAFYGVVIYMYWNERDHPVAHFHAHHAGRRASVSVDGVVLAGSLEARALGFVREWAHLRHDEIIADWERARRNEPLLAIPPLP
jgi:hypothetical protein